MAYSFQKFEYPLCIITGQCSAEDMLIPMPVSEQPDVDLEKLKEEESAEDTGNFIPLAIFRS